MDNYYVRQRQQLIDRLLPLSARSCLTLSLRDFTDVGWTSFMRAA
jgi:hypothetical protein